MNITVEYKKRRYGLGDTVRRYKVKLKEVNGFYMERPITADATCYQTHEVELRFRGLSSSPGRSWDELSEAEVLGGSLELSHDAARDLANAILKFLNEREAKGHAESLEIEVNEKPEHRANSA